jgi:hypothetical protein
VSVKKQAPNLDLKWVLPTLIRKIMLQISAVSELISSITKKREIPRMELSTNKVLRCTRKVMTQIKKTVVD